MTLRLVGNEPPKPPRKRRKYERTRLLTSDEEKRFRAALTNLKGAFGSWPCLAQAMGVQVTALYDAAAGRNSVSGCLIVRASKASGLSVGELLGGPVTADRCRACGRVRAA